MTHLSDHIDRLIRRRDQIQHELKDITDTLDRVKLALGGSLGDEAWRQNRKIPRHSSLTREQIVKALTLNRCMTVTQLNRACGVTTAGQTAAAMCFETPPLLTRQKRSGGTGGAYEYSLARHPGHDTATEQATDEEGGEADDASGIPPTRSDAESPAGE